MRAARRGLSRRLRSKGGRGAGSSARSVGAKWGFFCLRSHGELGDVLGHADFLGVGWRRCGARCLLARGFCFSPLWRCAAVLRPAPRARRPTRVRPMQPRTRVPPTPPRTGAWRVAPSALTFLAAHPTREASGARPARAASPRREALAARGPIAAALATAPSSTVTAASDPTAHVRRLDGVDFGSWSRDESHAPRTRLPRGHRRLRGARFFEPRGRRHRRSETGWSHVSQEHRARLGPHGLLAGLVRRIPHVCSSTR